MNNFEKTQFGAVQEKEKINKFGDSQKRVELFAEGVAEAKSGDTAKAIETFKTIINEINEGRLSEDPFGMYEAASWLVELGDYQKAIDALHKTLEKNQNLKKIGALTNPKNIQEHKEFNERISEESLLKIYGEKLEPEEFEEENIQEFEQLLNEERNRLAEERKQLFSQRPSSTRDQTELKRLENDFNLKEYKISEMIKKIKEIKNNYNYERTI